MFERRRLLPKGDAVCDKRTILPLEALWYNDICGPYSRDKESICSLYCFDDWHDKLPQHLYHLPKRYRRRANRGASLFWISRER